MMLNCHLLIESITDALFVLNNEGYITYSNPAATTITGYTAAQLQQLPLYCLYNGETTAIKTDHELQEALKNGQFISEGWRVKKDGDLFWGEAVISPMKDEQGNLQGYNCLLRDVSQKKENELQLRKREESYRLMVEGVRDYAIFMMDEYGYILTWNEGARRIKGYSANEIIGKHFSTFYTAEDLADKKTERELKIALATGKYEEEGWRVKKDGSVFWANIVITALYNEENKFIGFSKVTRDLTERKQNEESLRQSEERYRSLVEQVTDYGIFLMDEKGRIVSWNEGACRLNGYTADEITGKYFSIFYPEEDITSGKPARELRIALAEGKYEEEGWRLRKDGSRYWASIVITPVYTNDGAHIGFSKVARDLTERKKAEQIQRESYERYRWLAEELKVTNTELTATNRELQQFTSIVSHDLQEPVRSIKSFLQLIDMKLSKGDLKDLRTYIYKSIYAADRMKVLIHSLLQYTQLGKNEIRHEYTNVEDLINEVLQNLRTSIELSGAEIEVQNEIDIIQCDRVQLVQLLQNLISNALKFTDKEKPHIRISCRMESGHVRFGVSDNGIGISPADHDKVFQIFRRLNTKKEYEGTGIGLAICKKIVERHQGRIWPESEKGKGTTFYFTLNEQTTPEELTA